MMMKIEQVLWDWNGTLLDDLEYSIQVRNNIFPAFHLPTLSLSLIHIYYQKRRGEIPAVFRYPCPLRKGASSIPEHG